MWIYNNVGLQVFIWGEDLGAINSVRDFLTSIDKWELELEGKNAMYTYQWKPHV